MREIARFHRGRVWRFATLGLAVAALLVIAGSGRPASADPITWHCSFGPAIANANDAAYFTFDSRPGPQNDSLTIAGNGWCDRTLPPSCPVGLICDIRGESVRASIYGHDTEAGGAWLMHFGRCDADSFDLYPTKLWLRFYVSITMGTTHYLYELLSYPQQSSPDFPGSGAQRGDLLDQNLNRHGTLSFRTRLGGRCPPNGSFQAYFDDVTFTI